MRRRPRTAPAFQTAGVGPDFSAPLDPELWFSASEAAAYLKIFRKKDGKPSIAAIRNLVYRGLLRAYKPFGRLLFNRRELDCRIRRDGYSYGS